MRSVALGNGEMYFVVEGWLERKKDTKILFFSKCMFYEK